MEWKSWSNLLLTQREQLPAQPGIYVVVDAEEQVWYVGKSVNLNMRWNGKGHHRYKQLNRSNKQRAYKIYWHLFSPNQLDQKEQSYIAWFKPILNYSRVRKYARRAVQPNEEISRLLGVINRKTTLFPDVRSVVLGYYTEVDEDDEGNLKKYACIVIAININDHDRSILNSYNKSQGKQGNYLRECWHIYESNCGNSDPEKKPALIPSFVYENIVYEFVCCLDLIEKLAENQSNLCKIELANQTVISLKDTSILHSLITTNKRTILLRSEDYLSYRASDLCSALHLDQEFT
jgi:hypothetical protein